MSCKHIYSAYKRAKNNVDKNKIQDDVPWWGRHHLAKNQQTYQGIRANKRHTIAISAKWREYVLQINQPFSELRQNLIGLLVPL